MWLYLHRVALQWDSEVQEAVNPAPSLRVEIPSWSSALEKGRHSVGLLPWAVVCRHHIHQMAKLTSILLDAAGLFARPYLWASFPPLLGRGVSQGKLLWGGCISKCSSVIDSSAFSFPLWHLQIMRYLETGISSAWACQEYYHQCSSQPFLLHTWPLQIWNVKTQPGAETKATLVQVAIGSWLSRKESFISGELWITRK